MSSGGFGPPLDVGEFTSRPNEIKLWRTPVNFCWSNSGNPYYALNLFLNFSHCEESRFFLGLMFFKKQQELLKTTDSIAPVSSTASPACFLTYFDGMLELLKLCMHFSLLTRLLVWTCFLIMLPRGTVIVYWVRVVVFCCCYTFTTRIIHNV